ncbi:MAG: hypothetical protein PHQ03_06085 [Methylococcales bacterium]|nr:hypothetical protein [Methylococcales bacterium]
MNEELISVKEFAEANGLLRQTVFKVLKRHGIEQSKLRGGGENRGQTISYITKQDSIFVLELLASSKKDCGEFELLDTSLYDVGVFYLLLLEPEHDPNRFKVGFTKSMNDRLRQHRCSAPYTTIVKTWLCRRLWEKTAIECITQGCEQLHTEVFRTPSIEIVVELCDEFFALMPQLLVNDQMNNDKEENL